MSEEYQGQQVLRFLSPAEWLDWLEQNHHQSESIWMKFARKGSSEVSINYEQAREGALRYGWIDGQAKGLEGPFYLQRYSPRRARSKWSQINCGIVEDLIARGLMLPSGMAEVERAKADGRWDAAYAPPSKIEVPEDFRQLLEANPGAAEAFAGLKGMDRYRMLYRLLDAKKPETREKRKAQFLAELLPPAP